MRFFRRVKHFFLPHQANAYRPHALNKGPLFFLLAVALVTEALFLGVLTAREEGNSLLSAVIAAEVVALTNSERAHADAGPLRENARLQASAQAKAEDMAKLGYFSHKSPDGSEPWSWIERAGYAYTYAGENLAVRFVDSKDVVEAWMASPTHRANVVKQEYEEIGIGVAQGLYKGQLATFVVQHFGRSGGQPAVLGAAEVAPGPAAVSQASPTELLNRTLSRFLADPRSSAALVLGGIVALLCAVLAFAFFHHIQIQHPSALASGAVVAAVALALLVFNAQGLLPADIGSEPAAVVKSGL